MWGPSLTNYSLYKIPYFEAVVGAEDAVVLVLLGVGGVASELRVGVAHGLLAAVVRAAFILVLDTRRQLINRFGLYPITNQEITLGDGELALLDEVRGGVHHGRLLNCLVLGIQKIYSKVRG